MSEIAISAYVARWAASPFGGLEAEPWRLIQDAAAHVLAALDRLGPGYAVADGVAVHGSATVEVGAVLKGPAIVGPGCFVAAHAYLRGGVFLEEDCGIGPGSEVKSSLVFRGSKAAHFNFIGDSIVGEDVNLEAGAVLANHRNELDDKAIRIALAGRVIETGVEKFGALVGDGTRIGANAVVAPGAILARSSRVERLALVDQRP